MTKRSVMNMDSDPVSKNLIAEYKDKVGETIFATVVSPID
jgi:hypothetical protein